MNEIIRYDKAIAEMLEHVPMPPEDIAWAEMKKLLDEDDDDPVLIPFFKRWGCWLPAVLLALLLSVGGWFIYKNTHQKLPAPPAASGHLLPQAEQQHGESEKHLPNARPGAAKTMDTSANESLGAKQQQQNALKKNHHTGAAAPTAPATGRYSTDTKAASKRLTKNTGGKTKARVTAAISSGEEAVETYNTNEMASADSFASKIPAGQLAGDPANMVKQLPAQNKAADSTVLTKKDTLGRQKNTATENKNEEKKPPNKNGWMWAAGLGIYQPIPVNGEPAVPYNRYGRKGSLTDYIPAVYLRLYRKNKWFLHSGFRWGAPQAVSSFNYKQAITDSGGMVIRSIYSLSKTYYHQVPFEFNYFILPGLSAGGGVVYNHFAGAVARKEVYGASATQPTLLSSAIVTENKPGSFFKNHIQWCAEVQYQWRRLTAGMRYSSDINPYIQYKDINTGNTLEKKATALNFFLRYNLWQSVK